MSQTQLIQQPKALNINDGIFTLKEAFRSSCQGYLSFNALKQLVILTKSKEIVSIFISPMPSNELSEKIKLLIIRQLQYETFDIIQELTKYPKWDVTSLTHHLFAIIAALVSLHPKYPNIAIIGLFLQGNQFVGIGFNLHAVLKRLYRISHKNAINYPLTMKINLYAILMGQICYRIPAVALTVMGGINSIRNRQYYVGSMITFLLVTQTYIEIDWIGWTFHELNWLKNKHERKYYSSRISYTVFATTALTALLYLNR